MYTYDDSGKLIKEVSEGREKNFDSSGRLTLELFGNTRTTYSYDEHGRVAEMKVVEPAGELSISGGHGRYVYKYDSYGNPKETTIYNRDENVSQHYAYPYEYDSYGNWTKKTEIEKVLDFERDGRPATLELVTVEHRTISYY